MSTTERSTALRQQPKVNITALFYLINEITDSMKMFKLYQTHCCNPFKFRSEHPAVATPRGKKVNDPGLLTAEDFLIETVPVQVSGLTGEEVERPGF